MTSADGLITRQARFDERETLAELMRRASLANPGDREALLAHPEVIELPPKQIEAGQVFVAQRDGAVLGFAALLDRDDGETELDGLFVEPEHWREGIGRALVEHCAGVASDGGAASLHVIGTSRRRASTSAAVSRRWGRSRRASGRHSR